MVGFFGKKQYAAKAASRFTMKLSKHLCLECSIWAIFLSSSFTVSMMALFLSRSLSDTDIIAPFMLLLSFVMSCMPSTKRRWKSSLPIYPYVSNEFSIYKLDKSLIFEWLAIIDTNYLIIWHLFCNYFRRTHVKLEYVVHLDNQHTQVLAFGIGLHFRHMPVAREHDVECARDGCELLETVVLEGVFQSVGLVVSTRL